MTSKLSGLDQQWYIRRGTVIRGPFTQEKVTHFLLHGQIKIDDEFSLDQQQWQIAVHLPELLSLALFEQGEHVLLQQQATDKQDWNAQRKALKEEIPQQLNEQTKGDGLVELESLTSDAVEGSVAENIERLKKGRQVSRPLVGLVAFSLLSVMIIMIYLKQPEPELVAIDCSVAASPRVNWNNCQMEAVLLSGENLAGATMQNMNLMRADLTGSQLSGADLSFSNLSASALSGADLRQAVLVGTSLRGADLANVLLDGADLSYADLGGANLAGTSFTGVKLDKTKWVNGRICAVGSVGRCQ